MAISYWLIASASILHICVLKSTRRRLRVVLVLIRVLTRILICTGLFTSLY